MSTLDPRAMPFESQQACSAEDPSSRTTTSTKRASYKDKLLAQHKKKEKDDRIRLSKTRSHLQEQEEMSSAGEEQPSNRRPLREDHQKNSSVIPVPAPPSPNVSSSQGESEEEEEARDRMRRWEEIVDHAHAAVMAEEEKAYAPQDDRDSLLSPEERTLARLEEQKILSETKELTPHPPKKQVDHGSEHLNELDSANLKKTLMHAIEATYPELDLLMRELAVDYYLSNPDDSPEDILRKAPKEYFLDHTPEETGERLTEEQRKPWAALAEDVYNSARPKPAGVHQRQQQHPQSSRNDQLKSRLPAEL